MNSQFLLHPIPMERILAIANCHYKDTIPVVDKSAGNTVYLNVPAGGKEAPFTMDSIGNYDFIVTHITGTYTTCTSADNGSTRTDDGVSRLLFNVNLGGWNRDIARVRFPVEQFFTPGRVRHPLSDNNIGSSQNPAPSSLLIPRPFPMLLLKTQSLTATFVNTDAYESQLVTMSLEGWRVTLNEKGLQEVLASMDTRK